MISRILKSSIRFKLLVSLLSIVFLMGTLSIYIGIRLINRNIISDAYESLRNSLAATNELYDEEVGKRSQIIQYLAKTPEIVRATSDRDREFLYEKLAQIKKEFQFDIVNVVNPDGTILVRANNYLAYGDSVANYRYIQWVMKNRAPAAGTGILLYENIRNEGTDLAGRTTIRVLPTPHALESESYLETRALVMKSVSPIMVGERMVGILYAAVLLNNNTEFIDRFRRLIFREEKIDGRDVGTTTLFMGDVRITTNVTDAEGKRAIGTRVSEEVRRKVYEQGETWLGRAFVVDNWYLSGYSPIYDIDHDVLGMIYAGVLEKKFDSMVRDTTLWFLLAILVTTLLAIGLSVYLINVYTKPVKKILDASAEIAQGSYERIPVEPGDDKDARNLSRAFNDMVDAIQERDRQLKEQAETTILKSEKLASLGRLASGIAHEINNPLTGVLTYSSLLWEELKGTEYEEDLKVIRDETLRCRKIVRGVLDFARENKPEMTKADINRVIEECLQILEKHVNFQNVRIVRQLDPMLPQILVDVNQMQSAINNLAVNAADAMPNGGRLSIRTGTDRDAGMVCIHVADTGSGISKENLSHIFEPFFTTKEKGKGTGLGLAMTYGVIQRHNGSIDVRSKVGEGTEFTIRLPMH